MKSKKMLAQIAAFSLVFGMTGVVSSWADDIILDGTIVQSKTDAISLVNNEDGSFTVSNQKVKGAWLQNGSKLTANQVNFINGGIGNSEISVDNGSTLIVNGGSIDSAQDAFNVNDGSKAEVNSAKRVTTGAWANNAAITLKNSNTSGNWLYAGNAFPDPEKKNDNGPVKEGLPVGSITIDGGWATVKNVLVQNKGQFNVTNGAVLDVTKDATATNSEREQPATGIKKGGEIVVRAWGPAEKENSDSINKLDQVSTLAVNGATVKANKLTVEGKVDNDISYTEKAAFTAKNSTVEVKQATFNEYARGEIDNTKLNVNGDLTIKGNGTYDGNKWTFADTDGNVTVNDSAVNVTGEVAINGAKLYIAGHHSTTGSDEESLAAESEDKPSLTASNITLTNEAMLTTDNQAVVNADIVTVKSGTVLSVNGHSTLNAKHLKVSDTAKRVRVRGNFDGQVTDVNGNALPKEQVKKYFLLNPNDKTSLEFQDPEVDHTLVLHMNADGGLTMQGKDFSQADTGNTRTYIMASWSANGDYNAEGHNIKNVNSLSAKRLVINGTDITDSLGGAVNVSGKADTSLGNLTEEGKKVIQNTMKGELDTKADATTVTEELAKKADTSYVDEKVKDKVNTSDFTAIKDKVNAHETALAGKADKSYVDAAVKKATEGVATDANVANKADKDLANLSEAGKNVIKETMKDDLAVKADKTYVDDQLKNKVDTADFNKVKEHVDSNEKALATKADKKDLSDLSADLSAKVDVKADKTYVDGALDKKANAADVYTKTDTDKKIEDSLTDVNKAVAGKADKADVEKLGQKVDQKVSELKAGKADADASNIDAAAYTYRLNTGKVEDGNTSLVSGGAVWNAIKDVKNNTGAGWVKVNGDTVAIASDAGATKVSVAGLKGDRVLTGVKTDEKDASSAANVGYVNSTAISLTDSMNAMNNKLSDDIKNAGAVGAALAGLHHLDYDPDNKLDVAVAAGNYRGKSATAMGLFYQPNEMMMVSAGATIGADDNAYNVGLSFKVGKGQTGLTTSKAAMSQEIKELKAAKEESDQKMAAQDEEIRALKEQVAMLVKEMKLSNTVEKDMKK
ncbi:YadA-like family protein [uncultured Dialister sp.]|uniref:YadA C-terminal domain-containing protein n=2 Tax=Dialister TaxID=39948 RepID=UPI00259AC9CF|nr:YadA-like family protein [uncultured Dialister sp.]